MDFNSLPPCVVIQISKYLKDKDLFNALAVFDDWAEIISSYSKRMDKFLLELEEYGIDNFCANDLPKIPIKNVEISADYETDTRPFVRVLSKYKETIDKVEVMSPVLTAEGLASLLHFMKNLTHLELHGQIHNSNRTCIKLPKLKTLAVYNDEIDEDDHMMVEQTLECFYNNKSIEKFELHLPPEYYLTSKQLNDFVRTIPNLKHLVFLEYRLTKTCPLYYEFPAKLETAEITPCNQIEMFLRNQKETLKSLKILEPVHDGIIAKPDKKFMKCILKEMNLMELKWNRTQIIVDGKLKPGV